MRRYTTILLTLLFAVLVAAGCGGSEMGNVTSTQEGAGSTGSPTVKATTVSKGEEATVGAEPLTTTEETARSAETQEGGVSSGKGTANSQAASEKENRANSDEKPADSGEGATDSQSSGAKETRADSREGANSGEKSAQPSASSQYRDSGRQEKSRVSAPDFTATPTMSGGSDSSANTIRAVRFGVHEGYKRVVIDLGMGESPASTVPEWSLESPTGDGRLKVNLPSVSSTAVSGGSFDGSLLESFYVVRSPDGGMFVDIFSGRAFYYRVIELSDPARLAIDFKPSGYDLGIPLPARGGKTVVTSPREGETITSPLTVKGYSRNFEAQNTVILKDSGGQIIARKSVQSNDWASTWGYFDTTLEFPDFNGEGALMVGTESARDGSFEGVEIPVSGGG